MYSSSNVQIDYTRVFLVLSTLFLMWGFITVLNISLLNEIGFVFGLSYYEGLFINVALYGTYFLMAIPSGKLIEWLGFRKGIVVGTALAGIGCFMFYPAAGNHSYSLLLTALFILGSGFTVLQVAANPYIALLGMRGKGGAKLTFVQAFNSLGTLLAAFLATGLFFTIIGLKPEDLEVMSPQELNHHKTVMVQIPYLMLGAIWFLLSLLTFFSELPKVSIMDQEPLIKDRDTRKHIWQYPQVISGALSLFLYVGAEVSIAEYIQNNAESLTPFYWGLAMLGRFIGAGLLYVTTSPRKLMTYAGALAALLLVLYLFLNNAAERIGVPDAAYDPAIYLLIAVGFCNSIIWPTVFTMGIDGMGKHTIKASAVLVLGVVGGAVIPFIFLYFNDVSLWARFPMLVAAYVMVAWFGFKGSRYEKSSNFY